MDEIQGIMQKISLKDDARVSIYLDKSLLFEVVPPDQEHLTEILIDYIVKLEIAIQHAVTVTGEGNVPTFYYFESPEDLEIYIFIAYKSIDQWNSVFQSTEMQDYLAAKNLFFNEFGWVDHGYRIITVVPDGTLSEDALAEIENQLASRDGDQPAPEELSNIAMLKDKSAAEIVWNANQ